MAIKSPALKSTKRGKIICREIGRIINDKQNETGNSGAAASFAAARNAKRAASYYQKGRRTVRKINKAARALKKDGLKNTAYKKPGKLLRNTIKTVSKETLKNTGLSIVEGLYKEGTTDSTAGGVSLSIKTALEIKELTEGVHNTVQSGRKIYRYVNKNILRSKSSSSSVNKAVKRSRQINKVAKGQLKKKVVRQRTIRRAAGRSLAGNIKRTRQSAQAVKMGIRAVKAVVRMVKSAKAAVKNPKLLLAVIGVIACIALFISITSGVSSSGMMPTNFLMAEENVVNNYVDLITKYDQDMQDKIERYKKDSSYDDVVIEWMSEIGAVNTNWQEILSIMAAENEQDLTFSSAEKKRVKEIYEKMNYIKTRTEVYYCSGCVTTDSGKTCPGHTRLYVQVYCLDMEDIIDDIGLEEWEQDWARNLAASDWASLYPGISSNNRPGKELSAAEIKEIIANTPESSVTREQIRTTALSLVGKVGYFWGGKSPAGWNSRWGKSTLVTAAGNSTTGTYQPYGLDCSGFTDWVYKTAGVGNILSEGGSAYQWSRSYGIAKGDLKVGDLAFKSVPGNSGVNHVGIYIGKDASGKNLYCHCAWSKGVTVDSYKGFKYFRRPFVNFEEE